VEHQPKPRHSLLEGSQHPPCIIHVPKAHHEVVSISHDEHSTPRRPLPPLMHQQVQRIMQKDIGKQRADARSLRRSLECPLPLPAFQNARLQPTCGLTAVLAGRRSGAQPVVAAHRGSPGCGFSTYQSLQQRPVPPWLAVLSPLGKLPLHQAKKVGKRLGSYRG